MELEDILNELKPIYLKILKLDEIELKNETTALDVDGWDSLNHMLLIAEIENHFDTKFSLKEIMRLKNVGDICKLIQKKK